MDIILMLQTPDWLSKKIPNHIWGLWRQATAWSSSWD